MYGRDPPPMIRGDVSATPMNEVAVVIQDKNEVLEIMRDHLVHAHNLMRQQVDKT